MATITIQQREVEIALDHIERLGWFAEIELAADEANLEAARATLLELGQQLGLTDVERRSYLEMLLLAAEKPL